jgi:hypothetical protein
MEALALYAETNKEEVDLFPDNMILAGRGQKGTKSASNGVGDEMVFRFEQVVDVYGKVVLPLLLLWDQYARTRPANAWEYCFIASEQRREKRASAAVDNDEFSPRALHVPRPTTLQAVANTADAIRAHWMKRDSIMSIIKDVHPTLSTASEFGLIERNAKKGGHYSSVEAKKREDTKIWKSFQAASAVLGLDVGRYKGLNDSAWCAQLEWATMVFSAFAATVQVRIRANAKEKRNLNDSVQEFKASYHYECAIINNRLKVVKGRKPTMRKLFETTKMAADRT